MDIQRLRNITTWRLHTEIGHVYEDLEAIIGEPRLMTLSLPGVALAVEPWLREHIPEQRFWNREYDPTHTGEYELPQPTEADRAKMFVIYDAQPSPIKGKAVIVARV